MHRCGDRDGVSRRDRNSWHRALIRSNILALAEGDERPSVVVHLEKYYDSKSAMEAVISKLVSSEGITPLGVWLMTGEGHRQDGHARRAGREGVL